MRGRKTTAQTTLRYGALIAAFVCGGTSMGLASCSSAECADTSNCAPPNIPDGDAEALDAEVSDGGDAGRSGKPLQGYVSFVTTAGKTGGSATATFREQEESTCVTLSVVGPCTVKRCDPSRERAPQVSAGIVYLSGGALEGEIAHAPRGGEYEQFDHKGTVPMFKQGDALRARAAGLVFSPFDEQIIAPAHAKLTAPAASAGVITSPRSSNLVFSWSGGESGAKVFVGLSTAGVNERISCEYDAAASAGTIPSAVLANVSSGTTFEISQIRTKTSKLGNDELNVSAMMFDIDTRITFQ